MMQMRARDRYLWIGGCVATFVLGVLVAIVYDDMPDLAVVPLSTVTTTALGTAIWVAGATRPGRSRPADAHTQQMRILLEDARRLRAETDRLHRDVVRALRAAPPPDRSGAASTG